MPFARGPAGALLALGLLLALPLGASFTAPATPAAGALPYVLSFTHPLTPAEKADLIALGVVPTHYQLIPAAAATLLPHQKRALESRPYVHRIDPDHAVELHLDRALSLVRAHEPLAELGFTGKGVTIAVVDSGLDPRHPDLEGRVRASLRFVNGEWREVGVDLEGHGTHVAGIAAGNGKASDGRLRGVAPEADLVGLDFSAAYTTSTVISAFDWIFLHHREHNIRVVTNSWGRADGTVKYDPEDPTIRASDRLVREGLVLVFSAANKGPGPRSLSAEAMNPSVIAVGATDVAGVLAPWSGRGPAVDARTGRDGDWIKPDLLAAGAGIWSLRSGTLAEPGETTGALADANYRPLSGTSQAAPQVAAVAALMLQANPGLTPHQVKRLLHESAIDLGPPGPDPDHGYGLLDARDAVNLALGAPEDHGNILIAGGREEHTHRGRFIPGTPVGRLVELEPHPAVRDSGDLRIPLVVKPGATQMSFQLTWRPSDAAMRVTLTNGDSTLGPWTGGVVEGDSRVLRGVSNGPFTPGEWTLVASPATASTLDYTVSTQVTVKEQPERGAPLDPRFRFPDPTYATWDTLGDRVDYHVARLKQGLLLEIRILSERIEAATGLPPALALLLVAAAVGGGTYAMQRRRTLQGPE